MASDLAWAAMHLIKRESTDADSEETPAPKAEEDTSRSLLILILLLIVALLTSYTLQSRKIQAVHETVLSILYGSLVGLVLRIITDTSILSTVTFDYQFFFNLLLPPIILASGYELHQGNFFRNIGTILTFAFAGTFISAIVLGIILYVWALLPLEAMELSFYEAISVGATLSATDPVTILAIFNTYKVDPKLYTVIFGESILNDAVAIVLFQTAQRYKPVEEAGEDAVQGSLTPLRLIESFGVFLLVFCGSLLIGIAVGVGTSLLLKFTHIRRSPKTESCVIFLIAYASYFLANSVHLSGIVSLLFCGICLKHYAYYNMSRRTQLTIKFIFQILAQLSENFIFIYLGISLFTEQDLYFSPVFILITVIGICAARWCAVFPLSAVINGIIRYRARRRGSDAEEMPWSHQAMLFWAGLRGAVGVALAAGLTGPNQFTLKATVLVVVVLTVIIFGGTTSRMLEILNIRTGVVEDVDSDDEFDIEVVRSGSTYSNRNKTAFGHNPKASEDDIPLNANHDRKQRLGSYASGNARSTPPDRPSSALARKKSGSAKNHDNYAAQGLLSPTSSIADDEEGDDLDLPPAVRRTDLQTPPSASDDYRSDLDTRTRSTSAPAHAEGAGAGASSQSQPHVSGLRGLLSSNLLSGSTQDPARWFQNFDEDFIKPKLLLDPGDGSNHPRGPGAV